MRSVLLQVTDRDRTVTDHHLKYRLQIDRPETWRFASLSCPWLWLRSMRSVLPRAFYPSERKNTQFE